MTQMLTGVHAIISGGLNLAVLAEIASAVDFNHIQEANPDTRITEQQYEDFLGELVPNLIEVGLLTEELVPTYRLTVSNPII